MRGGEGCASLIEELSARLRAARDFRPQGFARFELGAETIGWIRLDLAARLRPWPEIFEHGDGRVRLRAAPNDEPAVTRSLAEVTQALARAGAIKGWRGETYAIRKEAGGEPLFHIERAAMRFFGLTSSASHLNGYSGNGSEMRILIARRSATKSIDPGLLDNLVAGGVPSGQDAWHTLLRECGEEAGIPRALAEKSRAAGVMQVCREVPDGLHREILHVHDLALPADFRPKNADGEVSEFTSVDAETLLERIAGGEMTVEAGLVAADFALRRGLLRDPDGAIRAAVEACRRG